ncbi:MAG: glucoamylase family protein [Gemmatimonadaceae bacterium]
MPRARFFAGAAAALLVACSGTTGARATTPAQPLSAADVAFLDTLERRTFNFFWETTNPRNGLAPDRWPDPPFSSVAAVGFALTAYPIGVERQYVNRADAAARTLLTLRFLYALPQGADATNVGGAHGFFYHFLDMESGLRYKDVELSSIDTSLLLAGVLFAGQYFDGTGAAETAIRAYADSLYRRVDWRYMLARAPYVSMGWKPESGFISSEWHGYNEAMILYVLALGSPTLPLDTSAWNVYQSTNTWGAFYGYEHVNFAPLFGHQYSHIFVDFRGIQDAYIRGHGLDYFENSRRATLSQRAYAADNPNRWTGYDSSVWGLTAADGPIDTTVTIAGTPRRFFTYAARGAALNEVRDDGTLAPTAAGGSIPFAPNETVAALRAMRDRYGDDLFTRYGFLDAFNPTFATLGIPAKYGRIVPGKAWIGTQYLGIDQGPIIAMIENSRTGLVWNRMRTHPAVIRGLCRMGFSGGWIAGKC